MKTIAILVAAAVCGFAAQAEAGNYRYGMTSIGYPMASYTFDRSYEAASLGHAGCGCEAPVCDRGCGRCCNAWQGFCERKRCCFKGLFHHCKAACCEPAPCCEAEPCCDPCGKKCGLFSGLFHKHHGCCEPACCEPAPCCDPCRKRCGLFHGLLHKCCQPACGCGGEADHGYEMEGEVVPQPAPVEEPMAFRRGLLMPVAFGL